MERLFVPAVRRGCEKQHVTVRVLREVTQEPVAEMTARAHAADTGMGLLDNHQLRAGADEIVPPALRLDVIQGDDRERIDIEYHLPSGKAALKSARRPGADYLRLNQEFAGELLLPLLTQVRRADDSQPFNLAPVEQFTGKQPRFDRLADADVIRNQQPDDVLAQGHEQGHELIGPWLDGQVAEAPEGASPRPQPEPQGIAHQQA